MVDSIMEKLDEKSVMSQAPKDREILIPAGFRSLPGLKGAATAHHLGYLRDERFVIAAFHPEAEEVIWKDGRHTGFGEGGADYYFRKILALAAGLQVDLTDQTHIGNDVLVLDRREDAIYIGPRACADEFLATVMGTDPPQRRCMCARPLGDTEHCSACPARQERSAANTTAGHPEDHGSSEPARL
ncbi:MAG: hypothetical protein ACP5QA_00740 [Phycisphaerae bacterium]